MKFQNVLLIRKFNEFLLKQRRIPFAILYFQRKLTELSTISVVTKIS